MSFQTTSEGHRVEIRELREGKQGGQVAFEDENEARGKTHVEDAVSESRDLLLLDQELVVSVVDLGDVEL